MLAMAFFTSKRLMAVIWSSGHLLWKPDEAHESEVRMKEELFIE
jgi:hypothetical protein